MLQYIITAIIILTCIAYYKFYLRPSRKIKQYAQNFKKAGYKVLEYPFKIFQFFVITQLLKGNKAGDAFLILKTQFTKYDIVVGNILNIPVIQVLSPQARKQFAKHQIDYVYQKLPAFAQRTGRIFGKGLILSQGDEWKRKRRICSKFFTYEFIYSKIPQIINIFEKSCNQIESSSVKTTNQTANAHRKFDFKLIQLTNRIFSNVILSIFLGTQSLDERIDGQKACSFIVQLGADSGRRTNDKLPMVLGSKYLNLGLTQIDRSINKRKKIFDAWCSQYIDKIVEKSQQQKQSKNTNLLQLLYNFHKSTNKNSNISQQKYSKSELIDELKIFFLAGTDTTSHFTEMMLYYTARNPQIYKKAQQEVDGFEGELTAENIKTFKYIEAIQKQTVRYYNPIPGMIPRVVMKDHYFNGIPICKGTSIAVTSFPTHYCEQIYENRFQFKPQRWLTDKKQHDGAYLSGFGIGPRSCIGQTLLALLQSKIVFICFLKRYKIVKVPDQIKMKFGLMYQTDNLIVTVQKRDSKKI